MSQKQFYMQGQEPDILGEEPLRTSVCCRLQLSLFKELEAEARSKGISLSELIRQKIGGDNYE